MEKLLSLAIRASLMYVFALVLLRLSGKRSLGKISPLDFIVVTIIGDLFDDVFWSEVALAQAFTAFTTLVSLHMLMSYAGWKSPRLEHLLCSTPTLVMKQGFWQPEGLARERTPREEVLSEIRMQGENTLNELQQAQWEPSGHLSIQKRPEAKPAQKGDLKAVKGK
jgi:uncharacterized membrane protein YcaP (DUF421 family)